MQSSFRLSLSKPYAFLELFSIQANNATSTKFLKYYCFRISFFCQNFMNAENQNLHYAENFESLSQCLCQACFVGLIKFMRGTAGKVLAMALPKMKPP